MQEEKFKDKFEGDDKDKIEKAAQEALDWLDRNQLAEKDEFEAKQKELEAIVNPFVMKVHQAAGGVLKDKFEGDGKDKIEKAVLDPPPAKKPRVEVREEIVSCTWSRQIKLSNGKGVARMLWGGIRNTHIEVKMTSFQTNTMFEQISQL